MIKGEWYKITEENGTVTTGEFQGFAGTQPGLTFLLNDSLFYYDEVVGIEKIGYVKKTVDKPLSKIGTPHG